MIDEKHDWLNKAQQSLRGAESEFTFARYDNAANRAYYACFQAAIAALMDAGIYPEGQQETWSHAAVQSAFARELIHRRKMYPAEIGSILLDTITVRDQADYSIKYTSEIRAKRALDKAHTFLSAVRRQVEEKA